METKTILDSEQTKFLTAITKSNYWQINYPYSYSIILNVLKARKYTPTDYKDLVCIRTAYINEVKQGNKKAEVKWKTN